MKKIFFLLSIIFTTDLSAVKITRYRYTNDPELESYAVAMKSTPEYAAYQRALADSCSLLKSKNQTAYNAAKYQAYKNEIAAYHNTPEYRLYFKKRNELCAARRKALECQEEQDTTECKKQEDLDNLLFFIKEANSKSIP